MVSVGEKISNSEGEKYAHHWASFLEGVNFERTKFIFKRNFWVKVTSAFKRQLQACKGT